MRRLIVLNGVFAIAVFLLACDPKPNPDDLIKDMVVKTSFDNTVNFKSYSTYSMPIDTIGQIYNADPTDTLITDDYGQLTSREVKKYIDKAGYSLVGQKQNPDLGILVFIVRDYSAVQTVSYSSIGYSYGYYGYGYSNAPYVSTYVSNSATLILQIVDLKNKTSQNKVAVIWSAVIGDVISSVDPIQKSIEGIDQSFVQSPYIKK